MDLYDIFQGGITENKWRLLGEYLKSQEITPGKGIKVDKSLSSGTIISAKQPREQSQSQAPPFSVLRLRELTSGGYAAELQEGWVIERHTGENDDGVEFHAPQLNGADMSVRPRNEITIQQDQFVYVRFTTDNEGYIQNQPQIVVDSTDQTSQHHQPPSGDNPGRYGDYYIKLIKLTIVDNGPEIVYYQQSDVEHDRLETFKNVGGARKLHKKWNGTNRRYEFRTLKQVEPSGRDYGKVIVDADGDESLDVNDSIKFSAIAERATLPQINVEDDLAGVITVKGNDNDATINFLDCSGGTPAHTLTFVDGLLTSPNNETVDIQLGECNGSGSGGG